MTQQTTTQSPPYVQSSRGSGLAHGLTVFAGVMMIMSGAFQAITGLVGVFTNEFYVATRQLRVPVRCDQMGRDPPAGRDTWSCWPASR